MRARLVRISGQPMEPVMGSVLATDARGGDGRVVLRKGEVLTSADSAALALLDGVALSVLDLEPGELPQHAVASRLAHAIAGPGTTPLEPRQGQARVRARWRGVLRVREEAVRVINANHPLLCFTRPDGQVVVEGDDVAGAKSAALATPEAAVLAAEALAGAASVVEVAPFGRRRAAVVVTDRLEAHGRALVAEAVRRKLSWFGSELLALVEVPHEADAIATQLRALLAEGAELLLVSGANALDPLDPVFVALALIGGRVDRWGVPAHPGSMVWVGVAGDVPLLGVATCAGFGRDTALDLLLARVLAGEEAKHAADELGHGGLVEGPHATTSFPPYGRAGDPAQRHHAADAGASGASNGVSASSSHERGAES